MEKMFHVTIADLFWSIKMHRSHKQLTKETFRCKNLQQKHHPCPFFPAFKATIAKTNPSQQCFFQDIHSACRHIRRRRRAAYTDVACFDDVASAANDDDGDDDSDAGGAAAAWMCFICLHRTWTAAVHSANWIHAVRFFTIVSLSNILNAAFLVIFFFSPRDECKSRTSDITQS